MIFISEKTKTTKQTITTHFYIAMNYRFWMRDINSNIYISKTQGSLQNLYWCAIHCSSLNLTLKMAAIARYI